MDSLELEKWRRIDVDLAEIMVRAEDYAVENGLKRPLKLSVTVKPFGFAVEVSETWKRGRTANMIFQRDGSPSMYELTSRVESEER